MNDERPERFASLEAHLAKVPVPAVTDRVRRRLAHNLAPLTWQDRLVGGFMAISSLAALYMLSAVIWQLVPAKPAPVYRPPPVSAEVAMQIKELKELALLP